MESSSKLNDDVLWKIFMINSDMTNDKPIRRHGFTGTTQVQDWTTRALVVTWTCSHVCRRWRELVLQSSSLWGRLIDLDGLAVVKPEWRDEILRRTGESTLAVKGHVVASKPLERTFFISILQDLWPRIQALEVKISDMWKMPNDTWDLLYRPAPALQVFRLRSDEVYTMPSLPIVGLFGDDAPLIRDFETRMFELKLTPRMRWFSQVRRLNVNLTGSNSVPSVYDWLQVLGQMPHIESLALYAAFRTPTSLDSGTITEELHRPNLAEIRLTDSLIPCIDFLAKITPRPDCSLLLSALDAYDGQYQDLDLTSTSQAEVISRYSQNYFSSRAVKTLFLAVQRGGFVVEEDHYHRDYANLDKKYICIDVKRLDEEGRHPGTLPLLNAFSSCNFNSITTLEFHVSITPFQALDFNVHRFLDSLPNVENLLTSGGTLLALQTLEDTMLDVVHDRNNPRRDRRRRGLLFPLLRRVKLIARSSWQLAIPRCIPFLASRKQSQVPVEVLDLTGWKGLELQGIFSSITGLKVIYHDGSCVQEHICGTNWDNVQTR